MDNRHQFRANWHDYNGGVYFVTICCFNKKHLFGKIANDCMILNILGELVSTSIVDLPNHHPVEVINYVVMPNHIHMLIDVGTRPAASTLDDTNQGTIKAHNTTDKRVGCLKPKKHGEICTDFHHNSLLSTIVGGLKSAVTRKYNILMRTRQENFSDNDSFANDSLMWTRQAASLRIWQPRYHEHIVKSQHAFDNIMNYIDCNVVNWISDCFF